MRKLTMKLAALGEKEEASALKGFHTVDPVPVTGEPASVLPLRACSTFMTPRPAPSAPPAKWISSVQMMSDPTTAKG